MRSSGLREDMRPTKGHPQNAEVDREYLDESSFRPALTAIAHVAFGIGQCRVQLVHGYRKTL